MRLVDCHIALVLPHRQFNEREYRSVRARLEAEGARVRVFSPSAVPSLGDQGASVPKDGLLSDLRPAMADALVFIGGGGARDLWNHPRAHAVARAFHAEARIVAAICLAPVILSRAGILRHATISCHPSAERELTQGLTSRTPAGLTVSGTIITASGPEHADAFAAALVAALLDRSSPYSTSNPSS